VKGVVKGLLTNTVGGVVTPAQILMEIVPLEETLEVEAFLENQDVGHVRAGQVAEIKVATYPFTKYGVIDAKVAHVAEDATSDERLGLVYRVRLVMDKSVITVNGKEEPLIPGMAVSAEIATDKRRVIEFVLAPLLRMKDESLRER
jgi:hemolysin D